MNSRAYKTEKSTSRKSAHRPTLIFVACVIGFLVALAVMAGLDRPTWGDEEPIVQTIIQFGAEPTMETLRTYELMTTPLTVIAFASWGSIFGFEIERLRVLSLLIALTTYLLFYLLLVELLGSVRAVWLGVAFLMLHPYMIGLSIFVFTDMMAIMFMLAACLALRGSRPVWFGCMLAAALLCRQYLGFVFVASLLYFGRQWWASRNSLSLSMFVATVLSTAPLLYLFYLWGGIHPDNFSEQLYTPQLFSFHPSALVLYVSLMSLYLLPVLIACRKAVWKSKNIWLVSLVLSALYFLFPISPSTSAVEIGLQTVGLLHRGLFALTGTVWLAHVIFYLGFLAALPVLIFIVIDTYERWKNNDDHFVLFLDLCILAFLLVMPFSYLHWEKYFMPLLPLLIIRLLIACNTTSSNKSRVTSC